MAKPDKAALKKEGEALKLLIAQARKKTLNFALVQGKDTMYLETHLKKNPAMLRKEAKKKGGGAKAAMGVVNVEGKIIIFSVEEEPPGPFPKLAKKYFMSRGVPVRVAFKLPDGTMLSDEESGEEASQTPPPTAEPVSEPVSEPAPDNAVQDSHIVLDEQLQICLPALNDAAKAELSSQSTKLKQALAAGDEDGAKNELSVFSALVDAAKSVYQQLKTRMEAVEKQLENAAVTPAQKLELAALAGSYPKAFKAALKAIKSIDDTAKPLDISPAGLEKTQKAVADAKIAEASAIAQVVATTAVIKQAQAELKSTLDALKTAADAATKAKTGLAALIATWKKIPDAQKATMGKAQKQRIANAIIAMKKKVADAEDAVWEADDAKTLKEDALDEKKSNLDDANLALDQAKAKTKDAKKTNKSTKKTARKKQDLLNALGKGVLSPDAPSPMSDEDVATIVSAYSVDTSFGANALKLVRTSDDRANVVDGVGRLTKGFDNEFKDASGQKFGTKKTRVKYANNALKMGEALGGDYFANMEDFVKTGGLNKTFPVPLSANPTWESISKKRATYVGGAMLSADGKVETDSPKAKTALGMMNFHPGALTNALPEQNRQFNTMAKSMAIPANKTKCDAALAGITSEPTSTTGADLLAKDRDKSAASLTKEDVKQAVMAAMFTPLNQGPVGSCFATGPARAQREADPGKVMKDLAQIAVKGTFTPAGATTPIKAVGNSRDPNLNKLPKDDNQLLRSWEYTVATAGAQVDNSYESKKLKKGLFGEPDGLNKIASFFPADKWPEVKTKLQAAVKKNLTFRYNATSRLESISDDGSSTKGNFEVIDKTATGADSALNTKAEFIAAITKIALKALEKTADSEIGIKIVAHCKSEAFITAICKDKYVPWALPGGGMDASAEKVLKGGNPDNKTVQPVYDKDKVETTGARTKDIMVALMERYAIQPAGAGMMNVSNAKHAFGGLSDHPSLQKLIAGPDIAGNIDKHLVKPGQKLAATKLALGKAQMIFEKQILKAGKWAMGDKGPELVQTALALKPTAEVTPKELKALVDTALEPLKKQLTKFKTETWEKKQLDKGKTVTPEKLAEKKKSLTDAGNEAANAAYYNEIIIQTAAPQFTIADTNWGGDKTHTYFVVIADPVSGEPKLFKKEQPSGTLTPMGDDWVKCNWWSM